MKLSEAIRAGARIRPQAYGAFQTQDSLPWYKQLFGHTAQRKSCAWGAALEAQGCKGEKEETVRAGFSLSAFRGANPEETPPVGSKVRVADYPDEWRMVTDAVSKCVQCGLEDNVLRLITHLNDTHRWTREEIALWVERLENAASPSTLRQDDEWPDVVGVGRHSQANEQ